MPSLSLPAAYPSSPGDADAAARGATDATTVEPALEQALQLLAWVPAGRLLLRDLGGRPVEERVARPVRVVGSRA